MIEYRNNLNNNIVEISIAGKVTETNFDRIIEYAKRRSICLTNKIDR